MNLALSSSFLTVAGRDLKTAVLTILVIAFILFRLMRRHQISTGVLVAVPLIIGYFGVDDMRSPYDGTLIALLAASLVVEFGIGLWVGTTYTMWREGDGKVWLQGTKWTILAWVVAFGLRFVFTGAEEVLAHLRSDTSTILLSIAATFVGQNIVMARRAGLVPQLREGPPPADAQRL